MHCSALLLDGWWAWLWLEADKSAQCLSYWSALQLQYRLGRRGARASSPPIGPSTPRSLSCCPSQPIRGSGSGGSSRGLLSLPTAAHTTTTHPNPTRLCRCLAASCLPHLHFSLRANRGWIWMCKGSAVCREPESRQIGESPTPALLGWWRMQVVIGAAEQQYRWQG